MLVGEPRRWPLWIAGLSACCIAIHVILRFGFSIGPEDRWYGWSIRDWPLLIALVGGGLPLIAQLLSKLSQGEFGADMLAGISIVTSLILGEYLAGSFVVLMLAGGEALEQYAVGRASHALAALAKRMPTIAHRREAGQVADVGLEEVGPDDVLVLYPHETCPVDGTVLEGQGSMDESFVSGEPYLIAKTPGTNVISGAVNQTSALVIRADRRAVESRYAQIMRVMEEASQRRPRMRRLGDQLGGLYTPLALAIAGLAWWWSGEAVRFLAVLVVATPCPLLIAIPVAILGSVSLAARQGIIIRDPAVLERLPNCPTIVFDKTGTLTYGKPALTRLHLQPPFTEHELLRLAGAVERYSKHPLAHAVLDTAQQRGIDLPLADRVLEPPGKGLEGQIEGRRIEITSRQQLLERLPGLDRTLLPPRAGGLECVVIVDQQFAGLMQFHDEPRAEGRSFVEHLPRSHHFRRVLLASGDRSEEVERLAAIVGIREVHGGMQPEEKVALVEQLMKSGDVAFVGDGINDAPALARAAVGIAVGGQNDAVGEAAGAVLMDPDLAKIDELIHISQRLRRIVIQSVAGGMLASLGGMLFAAAGLLPPTAGAMVQELIDAAAVLNALRTSRPPAKLTDY
jgi:heavy metal translocating P-type ATPase